MRELTAKEAMTLRKVLVADNEAVTGIEISTGTTGLGGSNCCGELEDSAKFYPLEKLKKSKIIRLWCELELCAVIGDRFYLRDQSDQTCEAYGREGKFILGDTVAYDTAAYQRLRLIYKEV